MKTLSLKLPEKLDGRLQALARKQGLSKSDLVREVLAAYVDGNGTRALSCYDLAFDLIVDVEDGPTDLSYNKRHMEGFGE